MALPNEKIWLIVKDINYNGRWKVEFFQEKIEELDLFEEVGKEKEVIKAKIEILITGIA